jgi:hypothetical protein
LLLSPRRYNASTISREPQRTDALFLQPGLRVQFLQAAARLRDIAHCVEHGLVVLLDEQIAFGAHTGKICVEPAAFSSAFPPTPYSAFTITPAWRRERSCFAPGPI